MQTNQVKSGAQAQNIDKSDGVISENLSKTEQDNDSLSKKSDITIQDFDELLINEVIAEDETYQDIKIENNERLSDLVGFYTRG